MAEYTPTTDEVRRAALHELVVTPDQFDRWLAAHDREVLIDYEKKRDPRPIVIQNIQGTPADEWLAKRDREVAAKALRDAVRDSGPVTYALSGIAGRAVSDVLLIARANRIEKGDDRG